MFSQWDQRLLKNVLCKHNWFSLVAGLSLVFAYAPFSQWWLPFVILPLWFTQIVNIRAKAACKQGFIFAFGWFASGISWVHVAIDQFGGLPLVISLLLMLLLCLYLAIYPALACYLSARFAVTGKVNLWLLVAFWQLCEYLRSIFLTGFPWLSLGYSQIDSPLAAFAPVVGEVGITFILLSACIAIYHVFNRNYSRLNLLLLVLTLLFALLLKQVNWVTPTNASITVAIVQANIKQEMKWAPEQEWPTMLKYLDLTRSHYPADIIIWPESAITAIEPAAQNFLSMADQSAALNSSAIITGIINYNFETKQFFNSLVVLGKAQQTDTQGSYYYNNDNRYYKNHLLPIGEFIPFESWLKPLAPLFNLPMSSFSRGNYVQPNLRAQGVSILPLICFEIAFPEQLAANMTQSTQLLLTVSNDSWFGDSHGPHQHLDMARMRALEFGRPLLRSTNNGITALIDHQGRITAKIPQFQQGVLKGSVQLVQGKTPYSTWWQWLRWLLPLLVIASYYLLNRPSTRQKE